MGGGIPEYKGLLEGESESKLGVSASAGINLYVISFSQGITVGESDSR